jgi:dolichyl-diphosphooligosaccharide---protein glycosyltransferase
LFLLVLGFYVWWNWFDVFSWYPLGRVVGQTLFPGLMLTAFCLYKIVHFFGFLIDIRDICVFTAPIFSGFTSLATYLFVKQVINESFLSFFTCNNLTIPSLIIFSSS